MTANEAGPPWEEVTDNYYGTPRGKIWLNIINAEKESVRHTIPVIPTNYTKLIMAFYEGDARITDGRDISEEEYKNGEDVCLVQAKFAQKNGLKVGDSLPLPLIWTAYYPSSGAFYPDGESGSMGDPLNDYGEPYSPFNNETYKIVGIYNAAPTAAVTPYTLGGNAVIIPSASVKSTDKNSKPRRLAMMGYSTSFQIPNGTIDKYMAAWEAQGVGDLEITFYDKGYSKIMGGLEEMKNMAALMFIVGAITTFFAVILFCHLFITKQRRRTAIERSLGLSKALCTLSMLAGVLVIVLPAYIFGGLTSSALTSIAAPQISAAQTEYAFDTTYSDWINSADKDIDTNVKISAGGGEAVTYLLGAAVIPLSLLIAWAAIRGNLKQEPLKLLTEKER